MNGTEEYERESNVRKESKLRLTKKKRKRTLADAKDKDDNDSFVPRNKVNHHHFDSKRLIPIPSFTPLKEAEENGKKDEVTLGENINNIVMKELKVSKNAKRGTVLESNSIHDESLLDENRKQSLQKEITATIYDNSTCTNDMTDKHKVVVDLTTTTGSSNEEMNAQDPVSFTTLPKSISSQLSPSNEFKKEPRTKRLANQEKKLNLLHEDLLHQSKQIVSSTKAKIQHKQNSRTNTRSSKPYKLCTLCSTCSCFQGSALTSLEQSALNEKSKGMPLGLARTDAEMERALIGRLARLEKSASWFDSLCTKVSKELKRHRKKIMERKVHKNHHHRNNVFLHDVDEIDQDMDTVMGAPSLSKAFVGKVMNKAFTFRKKHQPTLTQMLEEYDTSMEEEAEEHDENNSSTHVSLMQVNLRDLNTNENDNEAKENNQEDDLDHIGKTSSDEQDTDHDDDDVHLNVASYRGKAKNLWTASKLAKEKLCSYQLYDMNIPDMNEFDTKTKMYDGNDDKDGLLELLNAFETGNSCTDDTDFNSIEKKGNGFFHNANDKLQMDGSSSIKHQEVNMSQLSPVAKSIHKTMVSNIESEPFKLSVLEEVFPSWKENQRFILCQNSKDLNVALENVRKQRTHIQKTIELLNKQNIALQLFEDAIHHAIDRHTDDNMHMKDDDQVVTMRTHNVF